jgi:hypothetical protein
VEVAGEEGWLESHRTVEQEPDWADVAEEQEARPEFGGLPRIGTLQRPAGSAKILPAEEALHAHWLRVALDGQVGTMVEESRLAKLAALSEEARLDPVISELESARVGPSLESVRL